jgi:hypothetical protein
MTTTRSRSLLALSLAGLLFAAATPSAASAAGSYTVTACSPTTSAGAWQQANTFRGGLTSGNQCGGPAIGPLAGGDPGALYGEDLVGASAHSPSGAQAGWTFTAPAGTTITAISYYRSLETGSNGDWVAGLLAANDAPLDTCRSNPDPCSKPNNQVPVTLSGLSTSDLFFGIECEPVAPDTDCLAGGAEHDAQADMYSAKVTLSEPGTPSVSSLAGALWAGGVVWGSEPVTFNGADLSGISQVALDGPDGQLALQPQSCDYSQTQPCPDLSSGSLSLNTTQLHDGAQTLTLLVTNAAGNTTSVQSPTVVVDNSGPPAPSSLTATPVGDGSDAIELSWSDPVNPPQPVSGAFVQLCQAACGAAVAVNGSGGAQVTAPRPGTYTIRLWLVDQAGRGSAANAATTAVTVPAPPATPTATSTPKKKKPTLKVGSLSWHDGILKLAVTGLPKGSKLHVDLEYAHRPLLRLIIAREHLRLRTTRPRLVVLRLFAGKHQEGATISVRVG